LVRDGPKSHVVENEIELAWCRQGCVPANKLRPSCKRYPRFHPLIVKGRPRGKVAVSASVTISAAQRIL
jgi:hypothetical protein